MGEHPNATLLRGLFTAFREQNIAAIQEVITSDTVWHFPGRDGQLAGSHQGHEGIFRFLARVTELTGGTFGLEIEDVLANDASAVVFFRGHGSRNGRELDNPTCLKVLLSDGKATQIWEFVWNLYAVDEFWA